MTCSHKKNKNHHLRPDVSTGSSAPRSSHWSRMTDFSFLSWRTSHSRGPLHGETGLDSCCLVHYVLPFPTYPQPSWSNNTDCAKVPGGTLKQRGPMFVVFQYQFHCDISTSVLSPVMQLDVLRADSAQLGAPNKHHPGLLTLAATHLGRGWRSSNF